MAFEPHTSSPHLSIFCSASLPRRCVHIAAVLVRFWQLQDEEGKE